MAKITWLHLNSEFFLFHNLSGSLGALAMVFNFRSFEFQLKVYDIWLKSNLYKQISNGAFNDTEIYKSQLGYKVPLLLSTFLNLELI